MKELWLYRPTPLTVVVSTTRPSFNAATKKWDMKNPYVIRDVIGNNVLLKVGDPPARFVFEGLESESPEALPAHLVIGPALVDSVTVEGVQLVAGIDRVPMEAWLGVSEPVRGSAAYVFRVESCDSYFLSPVMIESIEKSVVERVKRRERK